MEKIVPPRAWGWDPRDAGRGILVTGCLMLDAGCGKSREHGAKKEKNNLSQRSQRMKKRRNEGIQIISSEPLSSPSGFRLVAPTLRPVSPTASGS